MRFLIFFTFLLPLSFFSQKIELFEKANKNLSKKERSEIIKKDLKNLHGSDLNNYIVYLNENHINTKQFETNFIDKARNAKYPYDLFLCINKLLETNKNKTLIEKILNEKRNIWDINNWSKKFFELIDENNLNVKKGSFYTVEPNYDKIYDVEGFLKNQLELGTIGNNPLLFIDYQLTSYEPGKLLETLKTKIINNISVTEKNTSIKLFGKNGVDGKLDVFTQ
ncbi:hypothetical protein [Chryseobacterium shigense]|uniref:Uncharacterized protein n=1 Tax=Chryseobacterium shigense TaxID=297244 RepID=A0A841N690_9FLAO|nr:hypothetical protein [Chryseobacterium shigense]MBB6368998.1 hypothetical protein [Chryseobacterium shigense]